MTATLDPKSRELLANFKNLPIIDTSTRRKAKHCRRQHYLQAHAPFGMGLRPKRTAPALWFGTMIHEALDEGYSQKPINYDAMIGAFTSGFDHWVSETEKTYKPWPEEKEEWYRLRDLGLNMMEEYARWAPQHDDFTVEHTEHGAFVPIVGDRDYPHLAPVPGKAGGYTVERDPVIALYYVRFDGIVRDGNGRLWVLEHKTCGRWWSDTMLQLDEQVTAYTWAAEQVYGEPVAGVLMNFLLKEAVKDPPLLKSGLPTTDMRKLAYTTYDRYCDVLHDGGRNVQPYRPEYAEVASRLKEREEAAGHPTLRREKIERSRQQVEEQGRRILRETLELLRPDASTDPSPNFLCSSCAVRDLCVQMEAGDDWATTAKLLYEHTQPLWDEHTVAEEE